MGVLETVIQYSNWPARRGYAVKRAISKYKNIKHLQAYRRLMGMNLDTPTLDLALKDLAYMHKRNLIRKDTDRFFYCFSWKETLQGNSFWQKMFYIQNQAGEYDTL